MILKAALRTVTKPKRLITIKVNEEDLAEIKDNAIRYAGGNMAAWMRYASMHLKPKREDVLTQRELERGIE